MSDLDHMRKQAEHNHTQDPQTPMANEQSIRDAEARAAYNAELARQREQKK